MDPQQPYPPSEFPQSGQYPPHQQPASTPYPSQYQGQYQAQYPQQYGQQPQQYSQHGYAEPAQPQYPQQSGFSQYPQPAQSQYPQQSGFSQYPQPAQSEYQQPGYAQPPYSSQGSQPPPYASQPYGSQTPAPPPYLAASSSAEARKAMADRGKRDIIFGAIWLAVGLVITVCSFAYFNGAAGLVAWGPAAYGIYKIIKGIVTIKRN